VIRATLYVQATLRRYGQERIDKEASRRQLANLQFQSAQQQAWQNNVTRSFRQTMAAQQRQGILSDLHAYFNPTPPVQPEPEPIVVAADDGLGSPDIADEDFNPAYWLHKKPKPIFRR
jgi:hypothetical protein